jgi:hypothetical protein
VAFCVLIQFVVRFGPAQRWAHVEEERNIVVIALAVASLAQLGFSFFPVSERKRGTAGFDNRTGLALLLEMARAWPKAASERVEARFAATGGDALDFAGLRGLVRAIRSEWEPKPTLVVGILAPGVSPKLTLASPGLLALAEQAAGDLWIPHGVMEANRVDLVWPFGREGTAFVALVGEPGPTGTVEVASGSLTHAGQLAAEIALRWARQQSAATAQDPGASLARSSQNPG